jgi:hypothetical protein
VSDYHNLFTCGMQNENDLAVLTIASLSSIDSCNSMLHGAPKNKNYHRSRSFQQLSSHHQSTIKSLSLRVNCVTGRNMRVSVTMNASWCLLVATLTLLWDATVASGAFLDKESDFKGHEVIGEGAVGTSSLRRLSGTKPFSGRVSAWELVDTNTNTKVMDLFPGAIVYSTNPSFSIKAVVSGSGTRSVSLVLNGGYTNIENEAPYALCKNSGQIFIRCDKLTHGVHTVTGQDRPALPVTLAETVSNHLRPWCLKFVSLSHLPPSPQ